MVLIIVDESGLFMMRDVVVEYPVSLIAVLVTWPVLVVTAGANSGIVD